MTLRSFGRLDDRPIDEVTIRSGAAEASIVTWGAVLRSLVIPGRAGARSVVLGLDRLEDYVAHSPFFGATIGRYANRIGRARFRLDGREVDLVPNENGNELHGGPGSFGRRPWAILGHDEARVHLALVSENGDMGYPGRLFATCTYEFVAPLALRTSLNCFCDADCPVNLTTHNYFNLDGSPDVFAHRLRVNADLYTPTGPDLVPTGAIAPVAGTRLDFRSPRPVRSRPDERDLDDNFVLRRDRAADPVLAHAATLSSPASGIAMELWTTEPGLQVYDGHLIDVPVPASGGLPLRPYSGLALEPQRFPDAPNHAHFPPCTLTPGTVSRQVSELRFAVAVAGAPDQVGPV